MCRIVFKRIIDIGHPTLLRDKLAFPLDIMRFLRHNPVLIFQNRH